MPENNAHPATAAAPKTSKLERYPLLSRARHWLLSRISLFQIVMLFMLLGERAGRDKNVPPIPPYVLYTHAIVAFVASTGLSTRLLPRLSLAALIASQLDLATRFAFVQVFAYHRWLRDRLVYRLLLLTGLYLRMLGLPPTPKAVAPLKNGESRRSGSEGRPVAMEDPGYRSATGFGLALCSVASLMLGLVLIPPNLLAVNTPGQLVEMATFWPSQGLPAIMTGLVLALGLLGTGLAYSCPVLLSTSSSTVKGRDSHRRWRWMIEWGDSTLLVCLLVGLASRQLAFPLWRNQGVPTWLQAFTALLDFTSVLSLTVYKDLVGCKAG